MTILIPLLTMVSRAGTAARNLSRRGPLDPEAGVGEVSQSVALAALGVVAVVAIWAAMQALGVDVIGFIREKILGGTAPR